MKTGGYGMRGLCLHTRQLYIESVLLLLPLRSLWRILYPAWQSLCKKQLVWTSQQQTSQIGVTLQGMIMLTRAHICHF